MDEMTTQELGRWGEEFAAQHLTAAGLTILDRNWRCSAGELDIVAQTAEGIVVFVEVKTRSGTGYGEPVEAVNCKKADTLRRLAWLWLSARRPAGAHELRFDVIGIVRRPTGAPVMTHLRGVF